MNKTVKFYWFVIFLSCMCNFKSVFSEESVPVHYKGKYSADIKNYEIVVPQRVSEDGSFISHLVSHHHSKRSTKELDFIFYKIPIGGKDYLIELTPNRKLISPGAVVEIHRQDVKKSADKKFSNQSINNEEVTKMFRNLDIRKLENTDCHFSGHVKGENTSKAALSTCYGLAGFIQIQKKFYTIEPVAEHNPFLEDAYPHILYKSDGPDNSSFCHTMGELAASVVGGLVRKRRESSEKVSGPIYIETLIVMDKTFTDYYEDSDCENYVLTVFNMAFNLFRDASSGLLTTLTLVRLIRLEVEEEDIDLKVSSDAAESLRSFQNWQNQINPGDDTHPNHHDIALLVTKVDVCDSPSACGLLGVTTIGKGCDPLLSAALCEDKGLRLGYVIAHEIGHLLGADHDCNPPCNGTDAEGLKTVMHPRISTTSQSWSTCSQAYFKEFFGSGKGICFFDEPEEHHFNVHDLLPGVMYNADFQCKHLIATGARECARGSTCESLNCLVPGYNCIVTHTPPAAGTRCGEDMWCLDNRCLVIGERPGAIDGNWGEWSAWSDCSRTCGSGVASSTRNCDKPQPSHGGKNCVGERKRYEICATTKSLRRITAIPQNISDLIRFISEEVNVSFVGKPCQTGRPSFRDIQCGEFDDWIYPEDGKTHSWKSYFFHDDNPCVLYCINEEKKVVALRPRVIDGTMCFRGIRDVCVAGICKSLPCDLKFDSKAVEDACGICHGDGTNCEFSEGKEAFSQLPKGFSKLVNVPSGSRNIRVEETSPTLSKIVVRDRDTKEIYVRGKTLGMYGVPGSQAWLGMIRKNQEALTIPGPITKPLTIWIQRLQNVTVKWSMALPLQQQRKPEFAWNFLKWGPCSAICGPGIQKSEPSCMEEKAGLVENSFCADLEKPVAKVRQCEVTKCQTRWMVGDWKCCDPQKKQRKRVVYCIKPIGEIEGESQIVSDDECPTPKPHDIEPCENRQKREDTEYNFNEPFLESDDAQYRPDNSEYGFHKKYEVYLKHFAALSVPQRRSETVPLHLVSSPHFKHYFHVLETPADPETSAVEVNLPNLTANNLNTQSKVSPEFLSETFSGQPIGVTRVQSVPRNTKDSVVCRIKKNSNSYLMKMLPRFKRRPKKASQRWKKSHDFSSGQRRDSYWWFGQNRRRRIRLIRDPENSQIKKFKFKLNRRNKNYFRHNFRNPSEFLDSLPVQGNGIHFTRSSLEAMPLLKGKQFRSHSRWGNIYNRKSFPLDRKHFPSQCTKDKMNSRIFYENFDRLDLFQKHVKPNIKYFDGSGLRRVHVKNEKVDENIKHSDMQNFIKKSQSLDFLRMGGFGERSKKPFQAKHLAVEDLLQEEENKRQKKKKILNRKPVANFRNFKFNRKFTSPRMRTFKQKRSNRKWKKPKSKDVYSKSGKDTGGSGSGTSETRKYLNNFFRENRSKIFYPKNAKPTNAQPIQLKRRKPIIKEGALVIDQDLPENQQLEIALEEDDLEPKSERYANLPQPTLNEKALLITGQDVCNLLCELQNPSSSDAGTSYKDTNRNVPGEEEKDRSEVPSKKNSNVKAAEKVVEPGRDAIAPLPGKDVPTKVTEKSALVTVPDKGALGAVTEKAAPAAITEKSGLVAVPDKVTLSAESEKVIATTSPNEDTPVTTPEVTTTTTPDENKPVTISEEVTATTSPDEGKPVATPEEVTLATTVEVTATTSPDEITPATIAEKDALDAAFEKSAATELPVKELPTAAPEKNTGAKEDEKTPKIKESENVEETSENNESPTENSETETETTEYDDYNFNETSTDSDTEENEQEDTKKNKNKNKNKSQTTDKETFYFNNENETEQVNS